MNKGVKITLLISVGIGLFFIIAIFILYIDFRTSPRYSAYMLTMANKNLDSKTALEFHNINKMVEYALMRADSEMDDEGNPFLIAAKANLLANLKETLPLTYKKELIKEYETRDEKVAKTSKLKIFYLTFTDKPISAKTLKVEKISKNKIKQSFCSDNDKPCYIRTFEKEGNIWKVSDIEIR